jgi:hypothetical protein
MLILTQPALPKRTKITRPWRRRAARLFGKPGSQPRKRYQVIAYSAILGCSSSKSCQRIVIPAVVPPPLPTQVRRHREDMIADPPEMVPSGTPVVEMQTAV